MIKVAILGCGNVGTQLGKAFFKSKKVDLVQVYCRSSTASFFLNNKIEVVTNLNKLKEADVYIIAILDDAITDFAKKLPQKKALVVHTSGAVAMNVLPFKRRGVFYPLQTISKNKKLSFKKVPFCIEANSKKDLKILKKLAKTISKKVYKIDSEQRKNLHVAAVFVNNFVNHLYAIAEAICIEKDIPFSILKPLILETANKIRKISPVNAQTGPAIRNDQKTIEEHLKLLQPKQQEIYKLLTNSIKNTHQNNS